MTEKACQAKRTFDLGDNATAEVQCAGFDEHRSRVHESVDRKPDGSSVTFRWPVEVKE